MLQKLHSVLTYIYSLPFVHKLIMKINGFINKKMDLDKFIYHQNSLKRIMQTYLISGSFILLPGFMILLSVIFGNKSTISSSLRYGGQVEASGFISIIFLVFVFILIMRFFYSFILNLKYGAWVSETQFYIRTVQDTEHSELSTPDMCFNFTDLTPGITGEFDICWGKCSGYDGKVQDFYKGLQFWCNGQRMVSADHITNHLDIPTEFFDAFISQIRMLRPELTISPDVLSRLSPPAIKN